MGLCALLPAQPGGVEPVRPAIILTAEKKQLDFADGLFEQRQYAQALEEYVKFLAQFPESASREAAARRRAVCLSELARTDEALAAFRQYIHDFPASDKLAEAETQIGILLLKKGELANAAQTLYAVVQRRGVAGPTLEMALYYLGQTNYQRGKWSECGQQMKDYVTRFPKGAYAPLARYYLAECLRKQNQSREAVPHYREVLKLAEGPQAGEYADLVEKAQYNLAEALYETGQFAEAGATFTGLAEKFPNSALAETAAYQAVWAASAENNQDRTLTAAQRFVTRHPRSPLRFSVMSLLAGAQFDKKDYDGAANTYRAIIAGTTDPRERFLSEVRLLWCDFEAGRTENVIEGARKLVESPPPPLIERGTGEASGRSPHPELSAVHLLWGSALYRQGKYSEALERFRQVTRGYPESADAPAAAYYGALCLYAQAQYAEAARAFEEYATRFTTRDDAPFALWLAGEAHRQAGDPAAAADRLTTLLAKYPAFARRDDALYSLFLSYQALAKTDEMVAAGEEILAGSCAPERAAEVYYSIALCYSDHDDYARAVEYARKVLSLGGVEQATGGIASAARYLLALGLSEQGKLDESAAELARLLLADPPYDRVDMRFHVWAAQYLFQKGQWKESRALWERLLARPEAGDYQAEARLRIGQASARLGDQAAARRQLLDFVKAYPDTMEAAEARLDIARTYAAEKQWKTALDFFEQSKEINLYSDENDQIVLGIQAAVEAAECRLHLGDDKTALRDLLYVVTMFDYSDEYRPRALYRLGEALEKTGDAKAARERWQEVVAKFPKSGWAKEAQKRLAPAGSS